MTNPLHYENTFCLRCGSYYPHEAGNGFTKDCSSPSCGNGSYWKQSTKDRKIIDQHRAYAKHRYKLWLLNELRTVVKPQDTEFIYVTEGVYRDVERLSRQHLPERGEHLLVALTDDRIKLFGYTLTHDLNEAFQ